MAAVVRLMVSQEAVMSSTHVVLSSAAAAAVVLGSHYIVDAFPLTRAAVRPASVDRAIDRTLAQQTAPPPVVPAAQKNPACSPNPLSVGPSANNRPHLYNGPYTISTPTRIVYVRPEYPQIARAARVQGVVVLEAQIERDGSVCSARVLRSIPLLDQSAIDAVLRWRFAPVAVPVIMTMTVNFTLQ
jgi:TonB family protein